MNPTKTAQGSQNSSSGTSPFTQIQELEKREKKRCEVEVVAMQKEKEDVSQAIAKKEAQATEELKGKAKAELKKYSEKELTQILSQATEDAHTEVGNVESNAKKNESSAVEELVKIAKDPDSLFKA
jgi:2-succinyl-5-enolpyruvyl-6-hydroxy-3-cyclohexene-1-carboxylate synthase